MESEINNQNFKLCTAIVKMKAHCYVKVCMRGMGFLWPALMLLGKV